MTDSFRPDRALAGERRRRWRGRFLAMALLAAMVAVGFVPTGSMTLTPGQVLPLMGRITINGQALSAVVPDGEQDASQGEVLLLTVQARQANLYRSLAGALGLGGALYPRRALIPAGMTVQEYVDYSGEQMRESAGIASVLASRAAGDQTAAMAADGVRVAALANPSADNGLETGDLITGLGGVGVAFAGDLAPLLRGMRPGASAHLQVLRDQRDIVDVTIVLRAALSGGEEGMLGAYMVTWQPVFTTHRSITVDTAGIGGPSGGLSIALAVHEALTGQGLVAGKIVAASGYVRPDGTVGPVGGARQKAVAASSAGATVMLVPPANAAEARAGAGNMPVVEVSSFDEALAYLRTARLTPR